MLRKREPKGILYPGKCEQVGLMGQFISVSGWSVVCGAGWGTEVNEYGLCFGVCVCGGGGGGEQGVWTCRLYVSM